MNCWLIFYFICAMPIWSVKVRNKFIHAFLSTVQNDGDICPKEEKKKKLQQFPINHNYAVKIFRKSRAPVAFFEICIKSGVFID